MRFNADLTKPRSSSVTFKHFRWLGCFIYQNHHYWTDNPKFYTIPSRHTTLKRRCVDVETTSKSWNDVVCRLGCSLKTLTRCSKRHSIVIIIVYKSKKKLKLTRLCQIMLGQTKKHQHPYYKSKMAEQMHPVHMFSRVFLLCLFTSLTKREKKNKTKILIFFLIPTVF